MTLNELRAKVAQNLDDHIRLCTDDVEFLEDIDHYLRLLAEYKALSKSYRLVFTHCYKALNLACSRLGRIEHDCKGCVCERCADYIDDEECARRIRREYLRIARAKE